MPRYQYAIPEPTADYVESRYAAVAADPDLVGVDLALQELFDARRANSLFGDVLVKASCLDRLYSTNVFAIVPMSRHVAGLNIDPRLDVCDPAVVEDIANLKLDKSSRRHYSFATKYCSFSRPDGYHIYDRNVHWLLMQYRKHFRFAEFEEGQLYNYSAFAQVLDALVQAFSLSNLTKKQLDKFLWAEAAMIWRMAKKL